MIGIINYGLGNIKAFENAFKDLNIKTKVISQNDDISKQIGMNNRFKYTITPGSDIYFVYNHNWIDDAGKYKTSSILGASKITYTHRF